MRILTFALTIVSFFCCYISYGQEVKLKTPDSEVADFIAFLGSVPENEQPFYKCFSTYAVPKELKQDCLLQLSFVLHSLAGMSDTEEPSGVYKPIGRLVQTDNETQLQIFNQVPDSDSLYWIDIRDFNWTVKSFETISKFDPYFVQPIISDKNSGALRLLSGNSMYRADWFIYHGTRSITQTDVDNKVNSIYRELLYSKVKQPKTVKEFRTVWGLPNIDKSRQLGNEFGTLVTKSKAVARHNRILMGYRTEIGWYYQTYDVKFQQGKRDYLENIYEFGGKPPTTFDGGEIFASNLFHLQAYDLYNDKEELADSADATIVRHLNDILGDARVNVHFSCHQCHSGGPTPSENSLEEFIKANSGQLYISDYNAKVRLQRSFLNNKFDESIKEHQELYAKALLKVNGLKPEENVKSYNRIMLYYDAPLDINQCAIECGVTPDAIKQKAKEGFKNVNGGANAKIPARLALLLANGEAIPREIWDSPGVDGIPGTFQQTMVIINSLPQIQQKVLTLEYVAYINKGCNIMKGGTEIIRKLDPGTKIQSIGKVDGGFTTVTLTDGISGWVSTEFITRGKDK